MNRVLPVFAMAAILVSASDALAHGPKRHGYANGSISRNVITPYYVGYYGSHYSYFPPDPIFHRVHVIDEPCWRFRRAVCWIAP